MSARMSGWSSSPRRGRIRRRRRNTGPTVTVARAAASTTPVFVRTSGRSSRPISPGNPSAGRNVSAVISKAVRIAGPKAPDACRTATRRCSTVARRAQHRQRAMAGVQRDHLGIDGDPQRDGDPAQADDGDRNRQRPHRREGRKQDQHQHHGRRQRAARAAEKQEHDGDDHRNLLEQRPEARLVDLVRQVEAVVNDLGPHAAAAARAGAPPARPARARRPARGRRDGRR